MARYEEVQIEQTELTNHWTGCLAPVQRACRGLKKVRLHEVEAHLVEEQGRTYLVLSGTQDYAIQTEVRIDLAELGPKGTRNAASKILRTVGDLVAVRECVQAG